jgi:6-phosphofructokinase
VQREPADARTLLEAALAAHQPQAAAPVLDWLQRSGIESAVLRDLATQLGARS